MNNNKLIINLTPTGLIPTKEMTSHVPVTPDEVIKDVLACRQYGVSMVHLHARDEDGVPTYKKDIYAKPTFLQNSRMLTHLAGFANLFSKNPQSIKSHTYKGTFFNFFNALRDIFT